MRWLPGKGACEQADDLSSLSGSTGYKERADSHRLSVSDIPLECRGMHRPVHINTYT